MKERLKRILAKAERFLDIVNAIHLDNPKTWKRVIMVCIPVSALSLVVVKVVSDTSTFHGPALFSGFGSAFVGWIAYCALEGIKREEQMKKAMAENCPYKLENPEG